MHFVRTPTLLTITALIAIASILTSAHAKPSRSCKFWCKEHDSSYFCCPTGKTLSHKKPMLTWALNELLDLNDHVPFWLSSNSWINYLLPVIFKRSLNFDWAWVWPQHTESYHHHEVTRRCPDLRPSCPRSYYWHHPPEACGSDDECSGWEKCCYDVCLDHKTCKAAEISSS